MVLVDLALALICFTHNDVYACHPILYGKDTPVGEYQLVQRLTEDPGYGGAVLQFLDTPNIVYVIHRTWTLNPKQKREERLKSPNVKDRIITKGCINVEPKVFDALVECCSNDTLVIK